jgi:tartrate dehydrogenase/decarboxylase/D-malate dehydrogenase
MLEHLGADEASAELMNAIEEALRDPATRTADVGGTASTEQATAAVLELLAAD